jgi:hypothetical protein
MSKIRFIYQQGNYPCFINGDIQRIVESWYDIEVYDPAKTYNPQDTVILITHVEEVETRNSTGWFTPFEQAGFRVVVDHLWDSDVDTPSMIKNGRLILRNGNWVWYRECIRFIEQGYHTYEPQRNYSHAFFMPMHKTRWHRDQAQERLAPVLQHALWSYVEKGILVEGDVDHSTPSNIFWEFYVNPEWYNSTFFSVVSESYMRSDRWVQSPFVPNYRTEVSEKLFKPCMFYHPMVVYGSLGTLEYLHREGFETFSNLWDESYDTVPTDQQRHDVVTKLILDNVDRFLRGDLGIDSLTQQKLEHNHARIFDHNLVLQRFEREIIGDLQRFLG